MAKVRLIAAEERLVPWLGQRLVHPDEVVEVPDDQFDAYVCQPGTWQPVEEPKTAKPIKRTAAVERASTGKDGD